MGIGYRCAPQLHCSFVVWDADVTPEQWTANFEKFANDPAFADCPRAIVDLSTAESTASITDELIRDMATRWRDRGPEVGALEWAIVPNGAWGRVRQFEGELESFPGIHTMVFDHPTTASVWLGIDPAQARRILDDIRAVLRAQDVMRSN
jgi:hypothetical protein